MISEIKIKTVSLNSNNNENRENRVKASKDSSKRWDRRMRI